MPRISYVYLVVEEPYHENSIITRVHRSLKSALESEPKLKFTNDGYFCKSWPNVVAQAATRRIYVENVLIYKYPLLP